MSKSTFPKAVHDFSKSNGVDTVFNTEGPSLTRQEFSEECDINSIMKRYEGHVIGGPGNLAPAGEPMYVDFTTMPRSLLEYMDYMAEAEASFMRLPAQVRKEFNNNAHAFVDFASDPENLSQMRTWGLAEPEKAPPAPAGGAPASPPASSAAPPAAAGGASTHGST